VETLFKQHDFNAFPVVEDGKVLGIVSKFDFLRAFAFNQASASPHMPGKSDRSDRLRPCMTSNADL